MLSSTSKRVALASNRRMNPVLDRRHVIQAARPRTAYAKCACRSKIKLIKTTVNRKSTGVDMSDKEQIAQERYGRTYEELDTNEKKGVGGVIGGSYRRDQLAEEHGGDASAGYSEMGHQGGSKGGEARKEQMAAEHGGDASAGYSEMGHEGGSKGGEARKEQMAAEHGGDASAGYREMGQKGGQA